MSNYITIAGLEIHLQVKTKSKMFSRVSTDYFQKDPNTMVDHIDFGLPGALPKVNKLAFEKTIRLALALNCSINQLTKFDRKNYYYPDLPKGYQISQFDKPIGYDGYVEIEVGDDSRRIRIKRVHLEEDTGKTIHTENGESLIDYNKSGIPLIEIVTEPDFENVEELLEFSRRLRQIVRYTDTSDAEMQKGQMRFELNISLKTPEAKTLPDYQIEVKNIGSISVLENVYKYEVERQSKQLDAGKKIKKQTRGLKDMSGETVFQRYKESSDDYRYFPEPDIPPITISDEQLTKIAISMPELPNQRFGRYLELGLEREQADIFVEDIERGNYFDQVIEFQGKKEKDLVREIAKWINSEIVGQLEKLSISFREIKLGAKDLLYLVELFRGSKITNTNVKKVISIILKDGGEAKSIIEEMNLLQIQDDSLLEGLVAQAMSENPHLVQDFQKNPNVVKALVGKVMQLSKGRANPLDAERFILAQLEK